MIQVPRPSGEFSRMPNARCTHVGVELVHKNMPSCQSLTALLSRAYVPGELIWWSLPLRLIPCTVPIQSVQCRDGCCSLTQRGVAVICFSVHDVQRCFPLHPEINDYLQNHHRWKSGDVIWNVWSRGASRLCEPQANTSILLRHAICAYHASSAEGCRTLPRRKVGAFRGTCLRRDNRSTTEPTEYSTMATAFSGDE